MTSTNTLHIEIAPPLDHPEMRALYEYWVELGVQANGLPNIQDFDPLRLPGILPNVWLLEVEPVSHRFRIRLAGENINAIYGRNIGRQFFADVFDAVDVATIVARYGRSLAEPAVFYATGNVYAAAGRLCVGERLGLPMLGRSGCTDTLLGATLYGGYVDKDATVTATGDSARFFGVRAPNHVRVQIVGP